jgi:hypothetical protein
MGKDEKRCKRGWEEMQEEMGRNARRDGKRIDPPRFR